MRKASIAAAVAAVLIIAWSLFATNLDNTTTTPTRTPNASSSPVPTTTTDERSPGPRTSDQSANPPGPDSPTATAATPSVIPGDEHAWETTVTGFGVRYANPGHHDRQRWATELRPYVTPPVFHELTLTDPADVPRSNYDTSELLEASPDRVVARIFYVEGWSTVVYLQQWRPGSWRVKAYDSVDDEDSD